VPNLPPDFYTLGFEERQKYLEYHGINKIIEHAKDAHIFLLGIGTINNQTYRGIRRGINVCVDEKRFFVESNFIPINRNGDQHTEFAKNLVGINIEDFRTIIKQKNKYVIAVAGGKEKLETIAIALKKPYFNVLVTDRGVARYLLDKQNNTHSK